MGSMVGPPQSLPPSSSISSPDYPPPPEPSPAALPFPRVHPPPIQQQPDDDDDDGDDPAVLAIEPIQEVCGAPTQETDPASTCTHEAEKVILENTDKLNEPVQESGEGAGHEEAEQGDTPCVGGKGAPDVTDQ